MLDPYLHSQAASMYNSPWGAGMVAPNAFAGGSAGFAGYAQADAASINLANPLYTAPPVSSSQFAEAYANPFKTTVMQNGLNVFAPPMMSHGAQWAAHSETVGMMFSSSTGAAAASVGGSLVGGGIGAVAGSFLGGPIGAIAGSILGSLGGEAIGDMFGDVIMRNGVMDAQIHNSLMGLGNKNSPYGGGFGYGRQDAREIGRFARKMAAEDSYFSADDITGILDQGIKGSQFGGSSNVGDIKSKLKGLKEQAKALVEIFGGSDISEIFDTLRRINSTGMTSGAATEALATTGLAARMSGQTTSDRFNLGAAKAEAKEWSGLGKMSEMDIENRLDIAYGLDKRIQEQFGTKENFKREYDISRKEVFALTHTKPGSAYTFHSIGLPNMESVEVLAHASARKVAKEEYGKDYDELTFKEKGKVHEKAMAQILSEVKAGTFHSEKKMKDLKEEGYLTKDEEIALSSQNIDAMREQTKSYQSLFGARLPGELMNEIGKRLAKMGSQNKLLFSQLSGGKQFDEKDVSLFEFQSEAYGAEAERLEIADQQTRKKSEMAKTQSFEHKWQQFKERASVEVDKFTKAFTDLFSGTTMDNLPSSEKMLKYSEEMMASDKSAELFKAFSATQPNMESARFRGSESGSFFETLRLKAVGTTTDKALAGVGEQAGLNGRGMLDAFTSSSADTVLAMLNSSSVTTNGSMTAQQALLSNIDQIQEGKSSQATAQMNRVSDALFGDSADLLENMAEAVKSKTERSRKVGKKVRSSERDDLLDMAMPLVDSGIVSIYGLSKMMDTTSAKGVSDWLRDTSDVVRRSSEAEKRIAKVASVRDDISFAQLKAAQGVYGVGEGTLMYMKSSGIADGMSRDERQALFTVMANSGGTKEGFDAAIKKSASDALALRSSGADPVSAFKAAGFKLKEGMTVDDIENLSEEFMLASRTRIGHGRIESRQHHGVIDILRAKYGMSEAEARKTSRYIGESLKANKELFAVASMDKGDLFSSVMLADSAKSGLAGDLMKSPEAAEAIIDMAGMSKDEQENILKEAKELARRRDGITDPTRLSVINQEWLAGARERSNLTDKQAAIAFKLGRNAPSLAERDGASLTKDEVVSAAKSYAVKTEVDKIRHVTGLSLATRGEQERALATVALMDREQGVMKSPDELKQMYDSALKKQEEGKKLGIGEKLLVDTAKRAARIKYGDDYEDHMGDVSGSDLARTLRTTSGLGGIDLNKFAEAYKSGTKMSSEDRQISILQSIDNKLGQMLDKSGTGSGTLSGRANVNENLSKLETRDNLSVVNDKDFNATYKPNRQLTDEEKKAIMAERPDEAVAKREGQEPDTGTDGSKKHKNMINGKEIKPKRHEDSQDVQQTEGGKKKGDIIGYQQIGNTNYYLVKRLKPKDSEHAKKPKRLNMIVSDSKTGAVIPTKPRQEHTIMQVIDKETGKVKKVIDFDKVKDEKKHAVMQVVNSETKEVEKTRVMDHAPRVQETSADGSQITIRKATRKEILNADTSKMDEKTAAVWEAAKKKILENMPKSEDGAPAKQGASIVDKLIGGSHGGSKVSNDAGVQAKKEEGATLEKLISSFLSKMEKDKTSKDYSGQLEQIITLLSQQTAKPRSPESRPL